MKANLSRLEPSLTAFWDKINVYKRMRKTRAGQPKFILHDGPPYANGRIHIGHALNKILKDIVIKYKNLRGFDCPYVVGWDCHGLPVEHQLFKELQLTKHDVEIIDFRKKARDYALRFVDLQRNDFQRLGLLSDWNNPYLTLDHGYERDVLRLLEILASEGYVYRGRKPVNWCPRCETALAEAEVEYLDKQSDSLHVLFKVTHDNGIFSDLKKNPCYFLIWTTTPWTLVSNVAVAVHPQLAYSIIEHQQRYIVVAKDLLPAAEKALKNTSVVIKTVKGSDLESVVLEHPFLLRKSPVILADFVSNQEGSGCVHIAPGHGAEDFSLVKPYNLDIIMPVNHKGIFEEPAMFAGKNVQQANDLVISQLREKKRLVSHETIRHSYPHCWRCEQPIIFRATFQWFIDVNKNSLRSQALAAIEKVRWIPHSGKERMRTMVSARPDWCISRQRLWGIPIPALRCLYCHQVILDKTVIRQAATVFEKRGSDSWFQQPVEDFLPSGFSCPSCKKTRFLKEFDILDVWFESGASFYAVCKKHPDLQFPADLYLEGSDQHRGWFQVSLLPSVATEQQAPFKTILTHGFVVDGEGKKMSKSLGNVIAPQEIITRYGAEILRLWAAYADYREDVKISENILRQLVDMYRKVRNTFRFMLGTIYDFNAEKCSPVYENLLEVDRFMLSKLAMLSDEVISSYQDYSFYKVCQKIFNFCNLDLSSFYLDILKDRLYTFSKNSQPRRSAQFVLSRIVERLTVLIAPILSFTAEEVYQNQDGLAKKHDSVFLVTLDDTPDATWRNPELTARWERLLAIRKLVLKEIELKREEGAIGSSLEASVKLSCPADDYAICKDRLDTLKEIFIVSDLVVCQGPLSITVGKAQGEKCVRCWNFSQLNPAGSEFSGLCAKCIRALKEDNQ